MPELPEVETVVRTLAPELEGQRVLSLELLDSRLKLPRRRALEGRLVRRVERIDKQVVLELDGGSRRPPLWLAIHLRMTGRLVWDGVLQGTEHLRARLRLDRRDLLFHDVRRFGTLRMVWDRAKLSGGGIEPLSTELALDRLGGLLVGSTQELKPWLLRQDRIAGIGNIYACEILHRARLSPHRRAGALAEEELVRLHEAVLTVLGEAVEAGGTTLSDYSDSWGARGRYQESLRVYGREGLPCPRCETAVNRVRQQGRSTFYCPSCQGEAVEER